MAKMPPSALGGPDLVPLETSTFDSVLLTCSSENRFWPEVPHFLVLKTSDGKTIPGISLEFTCFLSRDCAADLVSCGTMDQQEEPMDNIVEGIVRVFLSAFLIAFKLVQKDYTNVAKAGHNTNWTDSW